MSKPFNAVMIVTVPPEWRPLKVFHLPPTCCEPRFYATRVPLNVAIEIARTFNAARLRERDDTGAPIGTWALQIRQLKTRNYGHPDSRQTPADPNSRRSREVVKGGAS